MAYRSMLFSALIAFLVVASHPAWAAVKSPQQDSIMNAFSVWTTAGSIQETAADRAKFVGTLGGHLYVESDEGPIHAGVISCPVTLEINLADKSQQGSGKCTITADDGAQISGQLKCAGFFMIGCAGNFKFTGGTGRFEGIVGSGPVTIRSSTRILIEKIKGTADAKAEGIMFWRRLHYTLKSKAAP